MKDGDDNDKLMRKASQLATEVKPGRDLWPGIEQALSSRPARRRLPVWTQAAAVLVLVGGSSLLTYLVTKEDAAIVQAVPQGLVFEQTAFGSSYTFESVYDRAGANAVAELDAQLARLSPEVRADVQRNLKIIQEATAEINAALAKEPDNALLQELLVNSYREELALRHRVSNLTQGVMSRTDI